MQWLGLLNCWIRMNGDVGGGAVLDGGGTVLNAGTLRCEGTLRCGQYCCGRM